MERETIPNSNYVIMIPNLPNQEQTFKLLVIGLQQESDITCK